MGKCKACGKQTMGNYEYCMQCNIAQRGGGPTDKDKRKRKDFSSSPAEQIKRPGLEEDYLKNGYFNDKGYLREEIFTSEAMRVAEILSAKGMTRASLRRFYNKLRGIYSRFKDAKNFEEIKAGLYSFYPNVADAISRNSNVPEEFRQFIYTNVGLAVKDSDHLKGFVEHFQSVLAYFKESGSRR
ncbi:MAG: type III-A CRISPR-associated protein Csm2 [Dethiobacter sp.]|nr:MAG: type III-A CRISPR-associated protein Csm2 [Dethiobacter sp.]